MYYLGIYFLLLSLSLSFFLCLFFIYLKFYLGLSGSYKKFSHTIGFIILLGVHSISLLLFSIYLLAYGYHIKSKILPPNSKINSLSSSSSPSTSTRLNYSPEYLARVLETTNRINTIMFLCIVCYFFRVAIMFLKVYTIFFDDQHLIPHLTKLIWFLITDLLPVLPPVSKIYF